jgi:hypothetical protein
LTTSRPRSRTGRTIDPCQDHRWQDVLSPTSRWLLREAPASHEESPPHTTTLRLARGVSASHNNSPPARRVSVSYEEFPSHTRSLRLASDNFARRRRLRLRLLVRTRSLRLRLRRGPHTEVRAWEPGPTRTWCCPDARAPPRRHATHQFPAPCKCSSWRHARASDSDKSRNAALFSRATPDAPSREPCDTPTLPEALKSSLQNDAYLHLDPNVAGC